MEIQFATTHFYEYSTYIKGFSTSTIRRYKHAINYYVRFAKVNNLNQINNTNIKDMFFQGRMKFGWKPATFISYQKSLSAFFSWCLKQSYMNENPINGLEAPKLERRIPKSISRQDAFKLLEGVYNYPYNNKFIRLRNHAIFSILIFASET